MENCYLIRLIIDLIDNPVFSKENKPLMIFFNFIDSHIIGDRLVMD